MSYLHRSLNLFSFPLLFSLFLLSFFFVHLLQSLKKNITIVKNVPVCFIANLLKINENCWAFFGQQV